MQINYEKIYWNCFKIREWIDLVFLYNTSMKIKKIISASLISITLIPPLVVSCSTDANWEKVSGFNYDSNYAKININTSYKLNELYVELNGEITNETTIEDPVLAPALFAQGYVKLIKSGYTYTNELSENLFFLDMNDYLNHKGFVHSSNSTFLPNLIDSHTKIKLIYDPITENQIEVTYFTKDESNVQLSKPGFYISQPITNGPLLTPFVPLWREYDFNALDNIYYTKEMVEALGQRDNLIETTTDGYWQFKNEIDWHNEFGFTFFKEKLWINMLPDEIVKPEIFEKVPSPKDLKHLVLFKTSRIENTNKFDIPKIVELQWR